MRAGEVVGDRFEIERLAGSGGMGTIYRAGDRLTGRTVALKLMTGQTRESAARFEREALALSRVDHPAMVRYLDHGATRSGECWLAMEWLDGESLAQRLRREELSLADSIVLARRVAEGLGAAHQVGVVHRDVKPSNVLLCDGVVARAKLLDLGIARLRGDAERITLTGAMIGTPGFAAPEQARDSTGVDARADVFSLGCLLFRCLTGRMPFVGKSPAAVLIKTMLEDAPRVSELRPVPEPLDRLVARMLAKLPDERPPDGAAVARELCALGELTEPRPRRSARPALTDTEQRVLCVLLARLSLSAPPDTPATELERLRASVRSTAKEAVERHGGRAEFLAEGSLLVTLSEAGGASDLCARAARSALALRALHPLAPIALATGWGQLSDRWPIGEVVERAVRMLDGGVDARAAGAVRIDEVSAGLLEARFEVTRDAGAHRLTAEKVVGEPARTLLGKPTPCVGRDRELDMLEATFHQCVTESVARVVLVTAPAGVGKSRLRYELLRRLAERPMAGRARPEIWIGRGDPMSAGSPFGMIAPTIRRHAGVLEGEPLEVRRQKLVARVARHVGRTKASWSTPSAADLGRVTEFMGELASIPFPDEQSVQLRAARADAMLMGDQMRRAFEDFVAAECAAHPLLLVLEDLHWGDRPSVMFLDAALRRSSEAPLMVLALARPEVHDLLPRLWVERDVQHLRLAPLGRRACEQLLRATLGEGVAGDTVARLVERAAGNAFYLEELIRTVAEGKGDQLPDTVLAVAQARLDGLEPEARRALRAASVFGQVFWRGAVAALLGGDTDGEVAERLAWLADRELITARGERRFPGQEEFVFRHALVREAAYAMLTPADKKLGHRLAGDWLERAGETEPVVLAEHFERGGEPGRAIAFYRRAAEQALEGHDFQAALQRSDRAIACGATAETLGALELLQAEAHKWRGEIELAETRAATAMRRLSRGSAAWYAAAGDVALSSGTVGKLDRLAETAVALRDAMSFGPIDANAIVAAERAVVQLLARGRYALAEELQAPVEAVAGPIAVYNPTVRARVLQARAERALVSGEFAVHLRLREACMASFDDAGDERNATHARVNLGYAHLEIGSYPLAERYLREALATAERMGLRPVRLVAQHNLGLVLARRDALEEAAAMEQAAIAGSMTQGDRRVEGSSRIYMALIHVLAGDLEPAEREARAAVDLLAGSPPGRAYALGALARVLLAAERADEALPPAVEAMQGLTRLGAIEEGEALVRVVHAEALHASGDHEGARRAIAAARDLVLARADKIQEQEWRTSFLQRVPDHARTLELAAAWSASPV